MMNDDITLTPEEAKAQAAERMLDRMRIGIDNAIEALETVGYRVHQLDDGCYRVLPPSVRRTANPSKAEDRITAPNGFLAEYPHALTAKDVSEITGLHINSVRRLCAQGKIPSGKVGGRLLIPKSDFIELFERTGGNLE